MSLVCITHKIEKRQSNLTRLKKKETASIHTYIFSKISVYYFISLLEELRGVTADPSFSNCNTNKILRKCNRNSIFNLLILIHVWHFVYRWQMSNGPFLKDQNGTRKVIRLKVLEEVSFNISWSDPSISFFLLQWFEISITRTLSTELDYSSDF